MIVLRKLGYFSASDAWLHVGNPLLHPPRKDPLFVHRFGESAREEKGEAEAGRERLLAEKGRVKDDLL